MHKKRRAQWDVEKRFLVDVAGYFFGEWDIRHRLTEIDSPTLITPLSGRLQRLIDRRFFRSKYDVGQTLTQFASAARDEVELSLLTAELVRVLQATMQPESVSIWLNHGPGDLEKGSDN